MNNAVLMIAGILLLVVAVGVYTLVPDARFSSNAPTGFVVAEQPDCSQCFGSPVCAAKWQTVSNYDNACDAACNGARVIYDDYCEKIPKAS